MTGLQMIGVALMAPLAALIIEASFMACVLMIMDKKPGISVAAVLLIAAFFIGAALFLGHAK